MSAFAGTWLVRAPRIDSLTCAQASGRGQRERCVGCGLECRTRGGARCTHSGGLVRAAVSGPRTRERARAHAHVPALRAHAAAARPARPRLLQGLCREVLADQLLLHHLCQHLIQALGQLRLRIQLLRHARCCAPAPAGAPRPLAGDWVYSGSWRPRLLTLRYCSGACRRGWLDHARRDLRTVRCRMHSWNICIAMLSVQLYYSVEANGKGLRKRQTTAE